ncbi:MAG: aconitate hydratase, partial [Actinobacteria bacterium]|nr:aconitate hydratase [Actinomycetota bacterium]
ITAGSIETVASWVASEEPSLEIAFTPSRVLMQDFTGVPAIVDLAAMRDATEALDGDPTKINPLVPVELVIDHSIQVDAFAERLAFQRNSELEFERNEERYAFLRWGQSAFDGFSVVPPNTGICHQVNLEYLATVVTARDGQAFPDTLVGTDSHTTMINGLGVLGWGVGGIEAEAAMLGQPVSMLLPQVVGFRLEGKLPEGSTATDLVLTVTQALRARGVVGRFVEFYGPGLAGLPLADRATIGNMAPEYGATCGIFPIDSETIRYLEFSGRPPEHIALVEAYARAQGLFHEPDRADAVYSDTLELDLASVVPSLAGPRRPPSVMLGAGLLAKKSVERGLERKPWVKTSLAPGSKVVTDYLDRAGLTEPLEWLGFNLVGYGCTTCIGNSGPLREEVSAAIEAEDLTVCSVLSGNRNFEGRIHPEVRMNYLASPPLCVAYALAGRMDLDLLTEPLGEDRDGRPVYLRDIWPSQDEVNATIESAIESDMFRKSYGEVFEGDDKWNGLEVPEGERYVWGEESTYVKRPPYFDGMPAEEPQGFERITGARAIALLGDSVTTDHISPAGAIKKDSPAGRYLVEHGVEPGSFNSYGSRRGNHEVMMRGTFANVRLRNRLAPATEGGMTMKDGEEVPIFDAAMAYQDEGVPLCVLAGKEYGSGSSRDWAAKGPRLLGIHFVIAESYERIHRSNLVGMGVLPLQLPDGESVSSLGLEGFERFDLAPLEDGARRLRVTATPDGGEKAVEFDARVRIDTPNEWLYYRHGGILHFVLRRIVSGL